MRSVRLYEACHAGSAGTVIAPFSIAFVTGRHPVSRKASGVEDSFIATSSRELDYSSNLI
jgi:hypothetical protein